MENPSRQAALTTLIDFQWPKMQKTMHNFGTAYKICKTLINLTECFSLNELLTNSINSHENSHQRPGNGHLVKHNIGHNFKPYLT